MWSAYSKINQVFRNFQNLKILHRKYYKRRQKISSVFLSKLTGLDRTTSKEIIKEHPMLKWSNSTDMKKCAVILQQAKYSSEYVRKYLPLLTLPPVFLKNYLFICQEYACYNNQIGATVTNFNRFMNLRISILKEHEIIPSHVNVLDSILLYLRIPKSECNIEIDDLETVKQIYWKFYNFYLKRELETDDENVDKTKKNDYLVSFRVLQKNLSLMKKTFGFSNEKILEMPFLLRTDPDNTVSILRSARGVNLKEVIASHPRLLNVSSENIQIVNKFLKENEIDMALLLHDPEILRMDIDILMYRLAKLIYSPTLSVFKNHPNVCELLRKSGLASERIHILKRLNMDCYDLRLLTCPRLPFLKYIIEGVNKSDGSDVYFIVSEKLQRPLDDIKRELEKHNGVKYVPLLTVKNNFEFLSELGFTKDDVYHSVQILLYPRHLIESKLNDVIMNSVVVNDSIEFQVLNKKYFLPLALYYIEKDFRFTESGIYFNESDNSCKKDVFSDRLLTSL